MKTLREIMTKEVETLRPSSTVAEAAKLMRDLDVGIIPIVEGERLLGVITDRDIVVRVIADGRDVQSCTLEGVYSSNLTTAEPGWEISRAAELMAREQVRRLPVVENGRLVGIIAMADLVVDGDRDRLSAKAIGGVSEPAKPDR